jgi:regulator of nonsense transcripts 1
VTCTAAGDGRLKPFTFRNVLVDEAAHATEPETMIPVTSSGCSRVVLVGDHKQLGPVVQCKIAARKGLSLSLYERLIAAGMSSHMLSEQYRMHPALARFSSRHFYDNKLRSGVSEEARLDPVVTTLWPRRDTPMSLLACMQQEEVSPTGISYMNRYPCHCSVCCRRRSSLARVGVAQG